MNLHVYKTLQIFTQLNRQAQKPAVRLNHQGQKPLGVSHVSANQPNKIKVLITNDDFGPDPNKVLGMAEEEYPSTEHTRLGVAPNIRWTATFDQNGVTNTQELTLLTPEEEKFLAHCQAMEPKAEWDSPEYSTADFLKRYPADSNVTEPPLSLDHQNPPDLI